MRVHFETIGVQIGQNEIVPIGLNVSFELEIVHLLESHRFPANRTNINVLVENTHPLDI